MNKFDEWYEKNKEEMERLSLKLALNSAYIEGKTDMQKEFYKEEEK